MTSQKTTASHLQIPSPFSPREKSELARVWNSLSRAKLPFVGLAVLAITMVLALGAPFLFPYGSNEVNIVVRLKPPAILGGTWEYPLGTDEVGRDVLTRLVYGARVSLTVGFGATALAGSIGLVLGLLSGYFAGILDEIIMRVADILLGFPFLLLAMLTVMMLGPGVGNMILV
ncbi:MAG: ABC transporter permease, partial [Caldilineaceae bacterium SB0675_bin_29]|nr:ABC transporter permease [Caldilineaceae bacterium SB0675_bin_29]